MKIKLLAAFIMLLILLGCSGDSGSTEPVTPPNQSPTCTISEPIANSIFTPGSQITIKANCVDTDGSISKVDFYVDGVVVGNDLAMPYEYSWNTTGVTNGSHSLKAVAVDNAGAIKASEVNVIVGYAPVVAITAPANGSFFKPGITINISATATDQGKKKGKSVTKVDFIIDGTLKTSLTQFPYDYAWTTTGITEGVHKIKAITTDNTGLTSADSINVNIKSNQEPTCTITQPTNNSLIEVGSAVDILAACTDLDGNITKVEFIINNNVVSTQMSAPYHFLWNTTGTATDVYKLIVKATDNIGAVSNDTVNVTIGSSPVVTINSPYDNQFYHPGSTINISTSATDIDGSVTKVDFYIDGVKKSSDLISPYTHIWSTAFADTGIHKIKTIAVDNLGFCKSDSVLIAIRNRPPQVVLNLENGNSFLPNSSIVISASATDSNYTRGSKSITKVDFFIDGVFKKSDTQHPYNYTWNTISTDMGSHNIKAVATDSDGGFNADSALISIANLPPPPMVLVSGGIFNMGTIDIAVASPVHQVTLNSFYISKYEITNYQFNATVNSTSGYYFPEKSNWYSALIYCNKLSMNEGLSPCYTINGSTNPADWGTTGSAWDAVVCNWNAKGYRLPTEAEWEFAARGGNNSHGYTYSGSNSIGDVAAYVGNCGSPDAYFYHWTNGFRNPIPGGMLAANEIGTYDMSGNAYEWCWDWYGSYSNLSENNPTGPSTGTTRVFRGGCFLSQADECRVANRMNSNCNTSAGYIGFRIVRNL